MTHIRRLCRVAAFACFAAAPLSAQVSLTADQMRGFAAELLRDGDAPRALAVTEALLSRDPSDAGALLLRAQAAIALGEYSLAVEAAASAYGATDDGTSKFVAARLAARGHAAMNQDTRGQIWLRRARQFAPSDAAAEDVADDYRFLRQRNPFQAQLRFGITPSSNVNNGSSNEVAWTNTIFGFLPLVLNNEAQALDGIEISAGAQLSYRLDQSRDHLTTAEFSFDINQVVLSTDSEALLEEDRQDRIDRALRFCEIDGIAAEDCEVDDSPAPTGADYSFHTVALGLTHRQIFQENSQPVTFGARIGQSWYGGDPYSRFLTLSISHSWRLGDDSALSATAFADWRTYAEDRPDVRAGGINGTWTQRLDSDDRLTLSGGLRKSESASPVSDYTSARLGIGYDLSRPVAGALLGFDLALEHQFDFAPSSQYLTRTDNTVSGRVSARLPELEFYGFQPVVTLDATRTESTSDRFDTRNLSLGLDLQSSF